MATRYRRYAGLLTFVAMSIAVWTHVHAQTTPRKKVNTTMTMGRLLYWISTVALCLIYGAGAVIYLTQRPMVEEGFAFLGYPTYLITALIVAKIAAPLAILSRLSVRLSDLAYAGMFYHLLLAILAHLDAGDGDSLHAFAALALMMTSFFTQNAARKGLSANVPTRPDLRQGA